ncbi:hypothetical protein LTR56_003970 [Elasticomyces elasticus]|nr:hypothetical protein LTR56_003970 [Elasticomyces elasticus]KAK3661041.1 hypothetical protein LTR22_007667 [Elasticomyces elasticus]KAK4921049.1 hypothetical protein LTR49_011419 [Elasticomyces elasticus]KAK5752988.1 hypothetical protein LTS12_016959 [Elasticomyces elasticus]
MALMRPSFTCKIPQDAAVCRSADGLCGDITHIEPTKITDCTAAKALVVYKEDASYSLVHAESVNPWEVENCQRNHPIVQKACHGSKKMLKELLEMEKEVAAREVETAATTITIPAAKATVAKRAQKMAPALVECGDSETPAATPSAPVDPTACSVMVHAPNTITEGKAMCDESLLAGKKSLPADGVKKMAATGKFEFVSEPAGDEKEASVITTEQGWEIVDGMDEWDLLGEFEGVRRGSIV